MNLGGPVWHASAAMAGTPAKARLRKYALRALEGVGDVNLGEWHEWTGRAFHVRRRLTAKEQLLVGPAVDCRGTEEFHRRLEAARPFLPSAAIAIALVEGRERAQ